MTADDAKILVKLVDDNKTLGVLEILLALAQARSIHATQQNGGGDWAVLAKLLLPAVEHCQLRQL